MHKFIKATGRDYYANLTEKDVVDNKNFWKTIKPLLSNKIKSSVTVCLVEGEKLLTNNKENADILK